MPAPAAIAGTFADLKFLKSRSVIQIVIETAIENGPAVVAAFGTPQPGSEVHVAVARIKPEAVKPAPERERKPWAELSRAQQAGMRCNEPAFLVFLREQYRDVASRYAGKTVPEHTVRDLCRVQSRSELDDPDLSACGKSWDALDEQYRAWLDAPRYGAA